MKVVPRNECEKNCFTCSDSFVDEADKLHCMADGHDHEETVADDHTCDDWNQFNQSDEQAEIRQEQTHEKAIQKSQVQKGSGAGG